MAAWAIVISALLVAGFLAILVIAAIRSYRFRITTGKESLVGEIAIAETALDPQGTVTIEGERWRARVDAGIDRVEVGEEVIITRVDRLILRVAKKTQ